VENNENYCGCGSEKEGGVNEIVEKIFKTNY
jgi:hypothetical protein